jgi:hypothetical protein
MNNGDESDKVIQKNHRRVAQKLHLEIEKCIKAFFIGWRQEMEKWKTLFPRWTCPAISERFVGRLFYPSEPNKTLFKMTDTAASCDQWQPPQRGICFSFR